MTTWDPRYSPRHASPSPPDATAISPRFASPVESTAEVGSRLIVLQRFPNKTRNFAFCASMVVYTYTRKDDERKGAIIQKTHLTNLVNEPFLILQPNPFDDWHEVLPRQHDSGLLAKFSGRQVGIEKRTDQRASFGWNVTHQIGRRGHSGGLRMGRRLRQRCPIRRCTEHSRPPATTASPGASGIWSLNVGGVSSGRWVPNDERERGGR